jgi:hypothetical protein
MRLAAGLAAGGWRLAAGGSREGCDEGYNETNDGSAKRRLAIQECRMGSGWDTAQTKCSASSIRKYGEIRGQAANVKQSYGTVR